MYCKLICILYALLCWQDFIFVKSGCYMDGDRMPQGAQGGTVNIFCFDGGCSRIFGIASHGPIVEVFYVDDGHSWISGTASHGARRRRFLC
jgi:hypothetical protein